MFSFLYYDKILAIVEQNPKEVIAGLTAVVVVSEIVSLKKEQLKNATLEKIANLEFETARMKLELEQLKKNH